MPAKSNYKDSTSLKSKLLSFLPSSILSSPYTLAIIGPVLSGSFVYIIFSSLATPYRITLPLSIAISFIIFGLSIYYNIDAVISKHRNPELQTKSSKSALNFAFVIMYATLIIYVFLSQENLRIFVPWQEFSTWDVLKVASAIGICVFVPGYALVSSVLDRKPKLGYLPKFLLSYAFSVLLTGVSAYIAASIGIAISDIDIILGCINVLILSLFIGIKIIDKGFTRPLDKLCFRDVPFFLQSIVKQKISEFFVFTGLFAVVIISTCYMYDGIIIGDQWFHHGTALVKLSGTYRDFSLSGLDVGYPPLFSSFLAAYFDLSGVPTVNAYVSISFLNFIPVIAFYYLFLKWVPNKNKAALLATALFTLSSGFGWIYVLNLASDNDNILGPTALLEIYHLATIKTFDISVPNSFINAAHPDFSTPLIIVSLPAGFVLLGLIREKMTNRLHYILSISGIIILGYLFQQEFGIFVIVASISYLVFGLAKGSPFFIGVISAFAFMALVALFSPDDYYRNQKIFGVPIILIYFIFILSMWALYSAHILHRVKLPRILRKVYRGTNTSLIRFILGVIVVFVVSYLYVLSFIIWDTQLNTFDIRIHTAEFHVIPWHLYPLRLGVIGLLGLSFVLSYMFKRFEKEVFVFAILAIVALIIGPFYDEHRFNKYIMISMVGFASLFIYKILLAIKQTGKLIFRGLIISSLVVSSSLSILMYISYTALALENPNPEYSGILGKRFFPSDSEFGLINFLRTNLNPNTNNVAIPERDDLVIFPSYGIFAKIEGFGGIPITKLAQSPWTLDESTLDGLYSLLDYSNVRYIVLPKEYIHNIGLSDVLRFALNNFESAYENNQYIVLSVPHMSPPSAEADIALVSPKSLDYYSIPSLISNQTLLYDNNFTTLDSSPYVKDGIATLKGTNTVWSNVTEGKINYIEDRFRIIGDNKTDNHGGIVWRYGDKVFYAFIRPDRGLSISTPSGDELSSESTTRLGDGEWYTLKVVDMMNGLIRVFLNDVLQLTTHKPSIHANISNVGLRTFNGVAEFEPITIGTTLPLTIEPGLPHPPYEYYYSLTALALSNMEYGSFVEGDLSALSKKNIILPFDPVNARDYLEFAKKGGTVVVMNSDSSYGGGFSRFFCIEAGKENEFDRIESSSGQAMEVVGIARNIDIQCPGSIQKSFYIKSDQKVVPFSIEKEYGNGKVIFVNILPYFAVISENPAESFSTLRDIDNIINIKGDRYTRDTTSPKWIPTFRFVGNLHTSGHVTINSSSLLLPMDYFYAKEISIREQEEKYSQDSTYMLSFLDRHNSTNNIYHIKNLKLYGAYNVSVKSEGLSYSPSLSEILPTPSYGYIGFDIRAGSNITISLDNLSRAEFLLEDGEPIIVNGGEIVFEGINNAWEMGRQSISILVKRPEVQIVNGAARFQELHSNNPYTPTEPWASKVPLEIKGKTTTLRFDHINRDIDNKTKYVTYFEWVEVYTDTDNPIPRKPVGSLLTIPWDEILSSDTNIKTVVIVVVLTALTIYIVWSSPKSRKKLIEHKEPLNDD